MALAKRGALPKEHSKESGGSGSVWFNLKDGENDRLTLLHEWADSVFYWRHYLTGKNGAVSFPCLKKLDPPQEKCPGCEAGHKAGKRYLSFVTLLDADGDDELPARVWGYGIKVDQQLQLHTEPEDEDEDETSLLGRTLRVSRVGATKNDTEWTVKLMKRYVNVDDALEFLSDEEWDLEEFAGFQDYEKIMAQMEGRDIEDEEIVNA